MGMWNNLHDLTLSPPPILRSGFLDITYQVTTKKLRINLSIGLLKGPSLTLRPSIEKKCPNILPFEVEWKDIWNTPCHPKIQRFLWAYIWNENPTKEMPHNRGLGNSPTYAFCQTVNETREHVLRGFHKAIEVWNKCDLPLASFS